MRGIVLSIMRYCVHDGPGIRTTVFMKGCPLRCTWCHNPESQPFSRQVYFVESRCIGCMDCVAVCREEAIAPREEGFRVRPESCTLCGECARACPTTAREMLGAQYTPQELVAEVEKDRIFYERSGGGVTFSGGEPLSQPDFLMEALRLCGERGIHTAVDTCGFAEADVLRRIMPHTDLFLYDLKLMDEAEHIRHTGKPNALILDNLRLLANAGCRIWARLPVIPGVNDNEEHFAAVGSYLAEIGGVERVCLLPFHNISGEKYRRLGIENPHDGERDMNRAELEPLAGILTGVGVRNVVWS